MPASDAPLAVAFSDTDIWLYALLDTQDQHKFSQARSTIFEQVSTRKSAQGSKAKTPDFFGIWRARRESNTRPSA